MNRTDLMEHNRDRYLRLVEWLRRRYSVNGELVISVGRVPSRYARLEDLAAQRWLLCRSIW